MFFNWKHYILMFFLIIGVLCLSIFIVLHGSMYSDRIILSTEDRKDIFIIETYRLHIAGIFYNHTYSLYAYHNGQKIVDTSMSNSLWKDIRPTGFLLAYDEKNEFESAEKKLQGSIKSQDLTLDFVSDTLVGDFVTKTDPEYFRYMSIGKGKIRLNNEEKNVDIIVDNVISHDSSHARLSPGTKVKGYMGNIWDNQGNSTYFDISEVSAKGFHESYVPHSYVLNKAVNNAVNRYPVGSFSQMNDNSWNLTYSGKTLPIMNPIQINTGNDIYFFFDNREYHGFFNISVH